MLLSDLPILSKNSSKCLELNSPANTEGVDKWCIIDYGSGDDDNCGIDY
jgi:hypothetical protein